MATSEQQVLPIAHRFVEELRIQDGKIIENIVSATNLEFEMLMAPVLTPLTLR